MNLLPMHLASVVKAAYDFIPPPNYIVVAVLPNEFGWILKSTPLSSINSEEYYIIAIRGTENITDWLIDAEMEKVETLYGFIHKGFWTDFHLMVDVIINTMISIDKNIKVYVTGHSLGAAIATIVAIHLSFLPNVEVHTFASPKVGDEIFANAYKQFDMVEKTFRYVNKHDVVPHSPEGFGYVHVCNKLEFDDGIFGEVIENHSIDRYIRCVGYIGQNNDCENIA